MTRSTPSLLTALLLPIASVISQPTAPPPARPGLNAAPHIAVFNHTF